LEQVQHPGLRHLHSGGGAADTGHTTAKIITMGFTYGLNQGVFSTTPFSNGFSAGSGAAERP